jgi:hypothetical protein
VDDPSDAGQPDNCRKLSPKEPTVTGPFDGLTPAQRHQIRDAHATAKERSMKPSRLAGHTLPHEGRLTSDYHAPGNGPGVATCSCGEQSPVLPSTNARKAWHREHKQQTGSGVDLHASSMSGRVRGAAR